MSFLKPHTITVYRPIGNTAAGVNGYGGLSSAAETKVYGPVAANIYLNRTGRASEADLPSDALLRTMYRVVFDGPNGLIKTGDVIIDGVGTRYQVSSPYWHSFGWSCMCERLEV